ncbi:MAG: hypothetical protein LBK03_02625 [Bacteroidales bacterium]|nr:hypothetical protein [Bacteroidales bacterium]
MLLKIRNSQISKILALFLLIGLLVQLLQPLQLHALSGGPAQPEMAGFTPADKDNMVDLFSGNFHYTIPIMTVPGSNGGYPVNLTYSSEAAGMEHEASWVGLGWNLNPGAITRQVRGVPDDFKGDIISKTYKKRNNNTFIFTPSFTGEVAGANFGVGVSDSKSFIYNTYNGISLTRRFGLSASYVRTNNVQNEKSVRLTIGGSLTLDSDNGITSSFSMNGGSKNLQLGFNYGYNSKSGVYTYGSQYTLSASQKESGIKGIGLSVGNTFSTAAVLPPIHIPLSSNTFALSFQLGAAGAYLEGCKSVTASICLQSTPDAAIITPAYGLCYADQSSPSSLQDFNREKELCVNQNSKNLPLPVMTHDVYNVTGELLQGSFRAYRSDYGHFFDNHVTTFTSTTEIGADGAAAAGLQAGVDLSFHSGENSSGDWAANAYNTLFSYKNKQSYNNQPNKSINPSLYEPFYFKMSGEQTASESNWLNPLDGNKAVAFQLNKTESTSFWDALNYNYTISNQLNTGKNITQYEQGTRTKRTCNIEYQTGTSSPVGKSHHIKEFSIVNNQGERYTYGKTLYNKIEKEVIFSVPAYNGIDKTTLAYGSNYSSGNANGTVRMGKERLYSYTETPAYAYAYLLTGITSPDYVDINNNGQPDDGDLGYWVKFTYNDKYKCTGNCNNLYRWRFPYEGASYFMGDRSNSTDDKGSYNYGEKEISYIKEIETSTHKARFYASSRTDALGIKSGVDGEYGGGKDPNAVLYKLDSIRLYSKADTNTPIQTAVFEYNYSLCQVVPNSSSGKLTLKTVYFKYGNSAKGQANPYRFHYGYDNAQYNPSYNPTRMDRWGNYKSDANYFEHYVTQDKGKADQWTQAWLLTKIELPSGGAIDMEYESDDYAYVQDRQAMYMALMSGPGSFAKENGSYYVYFKKEAAIQAKAYVTGFKNNLMFFKTAISYDNQKRPDYIQGYIEVIPQTATNASPDGLTGKVQVKPFAAYDVHPVCFLAWQYLKNNRPDLLFNNSDADENQSDAAAFFRALISKGLIDKVASMYGGNQGFYAMCKMHRYYNYPAYNSSGMPSYVRLNVPTKIKYGGGARVKAITMQDNWEKSESSAYRQEYYYRKVENGNIISSGVAEYEPAVCAEETALRYPVYDRAKGIFFIEDEMYSEEPYGESYFPAANVGYSQVIVRTVTPSSVNFSASGIQRHEFYTAKDYPITVSQTPLSIQIDRMPNLLSILTAGFKQSNISAYSQGYAIELNNMHGQQKSVSICPYIPVPNSINQWILAVENSGYASKIEYFYKTKNGNRIDNTADVLLDDGITAKKILGQTYDFVIDQREDYSRSIGAGAATQFMLAVWFPPVFGGSGMAMIDCFEERVRAVATTKVIYNTGILERVKSYNKGAVTTTRYLQFDPYTGKPLLTSTSNEFEEPVYTYNIPAYWNYPNMGNAAENYRAMFFNADFNSNHIFDMYDRIDNAGTLLPIKQFLNGTNFSCWNSSCVQVSLPLNSKEILRSRFANQTEATAATIVSLTDPANPANRRVPMIEQFNASPSTCFPYADCAGNSHMVRIAYTPAQRTLYFFKGDAFSRLCAMPLQELIDSGYYVSASVNIPNFTTITDYRFVKSGNTILLYKNNAQVARFPWNNDRKLFEECVDGVLQASATEYKNNYALSYADAGVNMLCPEYWGLTNMYRPQRSNLYVTERNQTGKSPSYQTNAAYDGTFTSFQFFVHKNGNENNQQKPWTWNAEITRYSPFDFEIENRDALNVYSSALYGYKNTLVTAVAQNARYYEMGFDSFENDPQITTGNPRGHIVCTNGSRTNAYAHTGNYSLVTPSNQLVIRTNVQNSASQFTQDVTLNLIKDSLYVFSCWVRRNDCVTTENNGNSYQFIVTGGSAPVEVQKEQKIDCWQRIEMLFTPTQTGTNITLTLRIPIFNFYVDDIRIMPAKAVLKSYVYDNKYRLAAELDENNYATFYNYDEEGMLIQIKKETERGIQTLQTTRQNLPKR